MVFVGRVNSEKGTDIAAVISRKINMRLDVFGTANDQSFLKLILDQGETIFLHGHVPQTTIARAVADSKLFIFPCRWNEPFGLVLAESLACGTPIVGYANGSLPEIIEDGVTGFLVNPKDEDGNTKGKWIIQKQGIEGLEEAIQRINAMPEKDYLRMRLACRQRFEQNFTQEIMIEKYEQLFEEIIKKNENLNHHDNIQLQRLY
jgi:glycosyltransferase involved in cell wall biosynthesis